MPLEWADLPAVSNERVHVVDGSSYFSRPGPRLIDGVEILAAILHQEVWSDAPANSFERAGASCRRS